MQKLKSIGRYWVILIAAAIGLAGGLAYALITPTTYTATAVLFLASPASTDSVGAYQGDLFSQQRATTYVQLVGSDDLAVKVIDDLGLKTSTAELKDKVFAAQVPKTVLLDVSATDVSAQGAADIANAYATNFNDYVQRLETSRATGTPSVAVTVMNKAELPSSPSSIHLPIALAAGLLAGIVVGVVATLAWGRWRPSAKATPARTGADAVSDPTPDPTDDPTADVTPDVTPDVDFARHRFDSSDLAGSSDDGKQHAARGHHP